MKFAAKLLLENGISFEGIGFGFQKIGVGEVVFNTAITGYQEILTDPSYDGQIITLSPRLMHRSIRLTISLLRGSLSKTQI